MRLSPRFDARRPYERFHRQYGHMRRAYQEFQKYLITKPKPYVHKFPYGPCTPEQISNYINERAGLI